MTCYIRGSETLRCSDTIEECGSLFRLEFQFYTVCPIYGIRTLHHLTLNDKVEENFANSSDLFEFGAVHADAVVSCLYAASNRCGPLEASGEEVITEDRQVVLD